LSQSDWSRRRRSCSALTPGGADIISVTCTATAAFGFPIVASLSRDDFTQIAVQRVSILIDIDTDAPMLHVLFEILPVNLNGPSLIPVRNH
jgi:hypothetical protein